MIQSSWQSGKTDKRQMTRNAATLGEAGRGARLFVLWFPTELMGRGHARRILNNFIKKRHVKLLFHFVG